MPDISNMDDIIDVRDIIARVEELEAEVETEHDDSERDLVLDAKAELETLNAFLEEMRGNGGYEQWRGNWYPVTCVRESYFKDYAQELAEELDLIKSDSQWPANCIDWDQAARELQMGYTGADFDGITYYYQ